MRLHNKLAAILIAMAAIILVLSTVSTLLSIHYHLRLFNHQQPLHSMMVDEANFPAFDFHLEQALVQSTLLTFIGSLMIAVLIGFYVARRISSPLVEMKGIAERMITGEWNSRANVKGKDELAQLASSLNGLAEQLQVQEQLRINMSQDVAHELRTPLATLKSHMIALEDGIWEPTPERIHACYEEIERLISLVAELEELNYMDSPEFRLQLEKQSLAPAIHKANDIVAAAFLNKDVRLNIMLVPNVNIQMDFNRIIQILVNILTNALTHTQIGGQVDVRAEIQGEYVIIDIHDSGPGIASEDLPYIFERFYRGDKSRNRKSGGSGIGLAIVKKLVLAHKGAIWVENHNGALFHIRLPIIDNQPAH
ncbi:signal transduction histidine kinase [Paenibacillus phyllosphaerae]|uniref:histidine kinase n=1 Tax=Paenibacillus phyllosphaerae TaxID=274593 RepID=A0A7W5AZS5_9BACL|nr:signal transduction histidine kinase [Paenibacillus phyllosphaerae]